MIVIIIMDLLNKIHNTNVQVVIIYNMRELKDNL